MRVAFFGSSQLSCTVLRHLLESRHSVACVVTQPDQPAGRKLEPRPTAVCVDASAAGLPVLKPQRLRGNTEFIEELRALAPDALLVASYGQILPRAVLELTDWPLNVHPSLLPQLRGASPIRTALLQGLTRSGCCIMRMTPRLDDGDLLLCEPLDIPPDWNHARLETALAELGGRLALTALERVAAGTATLTPQDHTHATYCGTYTRADTLLDWRHPAGELASFVRAWDPDIGASTLLDGRRLKIWRAVEADGSHACVDAAPGCIGHVGRDGIDACTGAGVLRILELQPENKRRMSAAQFLAGNKLEPGTQLGG